MTNPLHISGFATAKITEGVKDFTLAGRALLTLHSAKTDEHMTFSVKRSSGRRGLESTNPVYFVRVKRQDGYRYLGTIFTSGETYRFNRTANSVDDPKAERVFDWFVRKAVTVDALPEGLTVYHHGVCGRCSRTLTDPVSIQRGIGPECRKKVAK